MGIIPGDQGPTKQEEGLFKISDLKSAKDVELAIDQAGDNVAADADSEDENLKPKAKLVKYSKDKGVLEEDLQYKEEKEGSENGDDEEGSDSDEESDHSGNEEMDIEAPEANETVDDETLEKLNKPSDNPLLVTMEEKDAPSLKERKASMWFGKDIFQGIEDDEELEEADVKKAIQSIKKPKSKPTTVMTLTMKNWFPEKWTKMVKKSQMPMTPRTAVAAMKKMQIRKNLEKEKRKPRQRKWF